MLIGSSNCSVGFARLELLRGDSIAEIQKLRPGDPTRFRVGAQVNDTAKCRHPLRLERPGARRHEFRHEPQQHLHIIGRAEPPGGNEHAHTRMGQRVFQLSQPVGWIDVHEDGAGFCRRVLRDHPLRAVAAPDADTVAALHPERDQRAGGTIGLVAKLSVRIAQLLMTCHERVAVAPAFGRAVQGAADGIRDQRRGADAVDVGELHLAARMAIGAFREARSSPARRRASTKSSTAVRRPSVSR